jgi:hypothetical protein
VALDGAVADLPGHRDRLLAAAERLGVVGQQHEDLAVRRQRASTLQRRRLCWDRGDGPLDRGQRPGAVAGQPVVASKALHQPAGPQRIAVRVDPVEREARKRDRPVPPARLAGRLGGALQQRDAVERAAGGSFGRLVPQLQRTLAVLQRLGRSRGGLRGLPGPHAGDQRPLASWAAYQW